MNAFQICRNTSDAVPLYLPQRLYLKPLTRLNISIQLPNVKKIGKSISHWEIMERLKEFIKPDEFSTLKVAKTTVEFVRFEAELEEKNRLDKVLSKLDNKSMKLKDISDLLRVRAAEAKPDCPNRMAWDTFFQEAKDMNEMKPGERPDTIHLANLPIKWFTPSHQSGIEDALPSEKILYRIFEKFGQIRYVDIPICDPYRKKMKDSISGFKNTTLNDMEFFEGYIQFKDYIGFTKAIDALRGMKLMRKDDDENLTINIKVDFDRSKHLSDASIRRREIVRERLVKKQREKEEREERELEDIQRKEQTERQKEIDLKMQKRQRRRLREEKRKAKVLEKLKVKGSDEINEKIAREEKKLLQVQRKLEAIRLIEELFRRIKEKHESEQEEQSKNYSRKANNELQRLKNLSELEMLNQKEALHNAIKGRVMLKSVLSGAKHSKDKSDSDSDSIEGNPSNKSHQVINHHIPNNMYEGNWFGYPYQVPPVYPAFRGGHVMNPFVMVPPVRGHPFMHFPGPSRGGRFNNRRGRGKFRGGYHHNRMTYTPEMEEQYMKYFSKFISEQDTHSRSRSHSPSNSKSRRRSYSRQRSYSRSGRSYSRSRSRSYSRSRTRSRSYHSRHSRSKSRSKRSKSRSYHTPRKNSERRSSSRSRKRNRSRSSRKSQKTASPRSGSEKRGSSRSRRNKRSVSIDSSKFVSPGSMRKARSKSWSFPRESEKDNDRWSKSPEKID